MEKNIFIIAFLSMLATSGCAVSKAATKTGVSPKVIATCDSLPCLQILPTAVLISERNIDQQSSEYIMRYEVQQGSSARAWFHAMADYATLGAWEIVGTPIEMALENEHQFLVKATCNPKNLVCSRIDIPGYNTQTGKIEKANLIKVEK